MLIFVYLENHRFGNDELYSKRYCLRYAFWLWSLSSHYLYHSIFWICKVNVSLESSFSNSQLMKLICIYWNAGNHAQKLAQAEALRNSQSPQHSGQNLTSQNYQTPGQQTAEIVHAIYPNDAPSDRWPQEERPKAKKMCETAGCVKAASKVLKYLDENVDPCDNFYEFACGKYLQEISNLFIITTQSQNCLTQSQFNSRYPRR